MPFSGEDILTSRERAPDGRDVVAGDRMGVQLTVLAVM